MPALLPSADGPVRREASARSAEGAVGGAVLLPVPVARFARQSVPAAPRKAGTLPRRLRVVVRTRWGWEWAAAAAVIAGVLASAILSHPTTLPAPASAAQTSVAARSDPGLALKVAREGGSLRVVWDRAAQGIANAQRAVLWIRDGDGQDKNRLGSRPSAGRQHRVPAQEWRRDVPDGGVHRQRQLRKTGDIRERAVRLARGASGSRTGDDRGGRSG